MAPNERPICDELADNTPTWEDKAIQMLDILKEYYCMMTFFDKINLSQEQKMNLQKRKQLEMDENGDLKIQTIQDIYSQVEINEQTKEFKSYVEFYKQVKKLLNIYAKGLDKKDIISMSAKSCLLLIEKLIEDNQIFNYIKASNKTKPLKGDQRIINK